jgi:hypothetical protein
MKIGEKFDADLIQVLEDLTVTHDEPEKAVGSDLYETFYLPGNPEFIAYAIQKRFSADQQKELVSRLTDS